jgi:dynactin complex subunit
MEKEAIALSPISSNTLKDDEIEKYFNLKNKIRTINRMGRFDDSALHVVNRYEYNEVIQLLIPNNALKSFENISSPLTSNIDEIEKLILRAIPYKGRPIYIDLAQSRFSDLTHFNMCCRGRSSKNFGASRFKKY